MYEALTIVNKINNDLLEKQKGSPVQYELIQFKTDGYCEIIEYCGNDIWTSENEGFIGFWTEETKDYDFTKFEAYIRNEINKFNKILGKIKV